MYKKFFMGIAAMAALTLVSCSSDDLNSLSDNSSKNEAISFDGYLGRSAVSVNGTRGSEVKIEDLQNSDKGFGVFGNYMEETETGTTTAYGENLFKNQQVKYDKNKNPAEWTYTDTKYWPTEGHINFLAYAPYDASKQELIANSKLKFNVTGQKDLLWANAKNQTKATNSGDKKVAFTFYHALAKIGYSLKQKDTYKKTTITVTSIKLVGSDPKGAFYTEGTFDLSKENNGENLWTIEENVTKQNFDWFTGSAVLTTDAANNNNAADKYLFVIPQDFSATATNKLSVVVEYTVQTDGTAALKNKVTKPITANFLQGKAYTINLNIGLTPIEFDVEVVKGWENGTTIPEIPMD